MEENVGMSVAEMQEIIEAQKREIKQLSTKVKTFEEEKDQIVENFKQSTSMLLERIKDLESQQTLGHERPQTACVLNNICKCERMLENFFILLNICLIFFDR